MNLGQAHLVPLEPPETLEPRDLRAPLAHQAPKVFKGQLVPRVSCQHTVHVGYVLYMCLCVVLSNVACEEDVL